MPWPLSQDYNEAIQNPQQCFSDRELKAGSADCNALGLPMPCSGNVADVYPVKSGNRKWAVKCFTRQIPGLQERYLQISNYLGQMTLPFMVEFQFLARGIAVQGEWYPVVKMQWVEGFSLNGFVRDNVNRPAVLQNLCEIWERLAAKLFEAHVAHCDLQHGNVLLVPGAKARSLSVRLVDYDGMYVPSCKGMKSYEMGHASYQHPLRLKNGFYGPEIDRFSHLVIYTAMRALIAGGKPLWQKYDNGDNLLFRQNDFEDPDHSAVFHELASSKDSEVEMLTEKLSRAARAPIDEVPALAELVPMSNQTIRVRAPIVRLPRSPKSRLSKAPFYWAASAGGLMLAGIILFIALRGSWERESNGPKPSEGSQPITMQTARPVRPADAPSTRSADSQTDPEPKKDAETKIDPDPKIEAEPPKDSEPKKDVASEPSAATNDKLLPVPAKDDFAKAEKRVKDQFKSDFAKRKLTEMLALANKLRTVALDTKDDPSVRFVLFNEARMLAARAGDEQLALRIVDDLAREYHITPLALKCETLELTADSPANVAGYKALVGYTFQVMDRALAEDSFDIAARLLKVGEIAAAKSKSAAQTASVQARVKEMDALRKEYSKARSAAEVLAKDTLDPDANLVLGKYVCFGKGDWKKGLLMLA
jgi:hypothetical protein